MPDELLAADFIVSGNVFATVKQAVWLRREGTYAVVLVENDHGGWVEIIRENLAGWPEVEFSHIKESERVKA
jgi:hypothetical protein